MMSAELLQAIGAVLVERGVSVRPITPSDSDFLYRLYASTREDELAPTGWSVDQKHAFLSMQFHAQHRFYQEQFAQALFLVIQLDGQAIGRIYLDQRADELRIIDIALLPEHRNAGIGSAFLAAVLAAGKRFALPVRIHVEHFNPALRLYTRLGFRKIGDNGVYFLMEWAS